MRTPFDSNPLRHLNAWRLRRVLARVVADPRYVRGMAWGAPRAGHPEGSVAAHVAQLEANVAALAPRLWHADTEAKLRLLSHVHDTFKGDVEARVPIRDPRSHASRARAFLAEFVRDRELLAMVQLHDEGRSIWKRLASEPDAAARRFDELLGTIRDWDTYLTFTIVDGCTPGKDPRWLEWFIDEVRRRRRTRVDRGWLLPAGR